MRKTIVAAVLAALALGAGGAVVVGAGAGCEEDVAKKVSGCKPACDRMVEDCNTELAVLASLPEMGGPFGSSADCQQSCLGSDLEDAGGDKTTWGMTVDCGIADAVAEAASVSAMCEAFKFCVYKDVSAVKLGACPYTCDYMDECSTKFQFTWQILDNYQWTDKATCETDCTGADWSTSKWSKAAECTLSKQIPTTSDDCSKFETCVLANQ